jgi:hypothetical protein
MDESMGSLIDHFDPHDPRLMRERCRVAHSDEYGGPLGGNQNVLT